MLFRFWWAREQSRNENRRRESRCRKQCSNRTTSNLCCRRRPSLASRQSSPSHANAPWRAQHPRSGGNGGSASSGRRPSSPAGPSCRSCWKKRTSQACSPRRTEPSCSGRGEVPLAWRGASGRVGREPETYRRTRGRLLSGSGRFGARRWSRRCGAGPPHIAGGNGRDNGSCAGPLRTWRDERFNLN